VAPQILDEDSLVQLIRETLEHQKTYRDPTLDFVDLKYVLFEAEDGGGFIRFGPTTWFHQDVVNVAFAQVTSTDSAPPAEIRWFRGFARASLPDPRAAPDVEYSLSFDPCARVLTYAGQALLIRTLSGYRGQQIAVGFD